MEVETALILMTEYFQDNLEHILEDKVLIKNKFIYFLYYDMFDRSSVRIWTPVCANSWGIRLASFCADKLIKYIRVTRRVETLNESGASAHRKNGESIIERAEEYKWALISPWHQTYSTRFYLMISISE